MAGAFGQGDIDYLSVENGSPADDHYRGAALVLRQSGSRSTGLPSAGLCNSEREVVEQVRRMVIHEVGHHFGIDEARLGELGW